MPERVIIALGLLALLVLATVATRWLWERYRRALVARLGRDGVAAEDGTRVLYFSTPYCVTCREMQEPALRRLEEIAPGALAVRKVDPLEQPELARRYKVVTVPTTAVFDERGNLVEVNYGYAPLARLAQQLNIDLPQEALARYEI